MSRPASWRYCYCLDRRELVEQGASRMTGRSRRATARTRRRSGGLPDSRRDSADTAYLLDYLVGPGEQGRWHGQSERVGRLEVAGSMAKAIVAKREQEGLVSSAPAASARRAVTHRLGRSPQPAVPRAGVSFTDSDRARLCAPGDKGREGNEYAGCLEHGVVLLHIPPPPAPPPPPPPPAASGALGRSVTVTTAPPCLSDRRHTVTRACAGTMR